MLKSGFNLLLGAVIFFAVFIHEGESRKCYHCSSHVGGVCGDMSFANTSLISTRTCEQSEKFCGKVEVKTTGGYTNITRGCFSVKSCADVKVWAGSSKYCSFCESDLCNFSLAAMPSFVVGVSALCFLKFCASLVMRA